LKRQKAYQCHVFVVATALVPIFYLSSFVKLMTKSKQPDILKLKQKQKRNAKRKPKHNTEIRNQKPKKQNPNQTESFIQKRNL
jgi:hypothetical protein